MKIGLITYYVHDPHESLAHVRCTTASALARDHQLQPYSPEYAFASPARQRQLLKDWLAECDVVVGALDGGVLRAREELGRPTPYVCLLLGSMSRGAAALANAHRSLHTYDVLLGNCEADCALAAKFFPNAAVRSVPFAFDESVYFPAGEDAAARARARLEIAPGDPLLVYAGRITLEKNLHTLLKTFRVVLNAAPSARLVIAGEEIRAPFTEFGAFPLGIKRMLLRLMAHLDLDESRVLFVGQQSADELRELYSAADALVNLTLHHDENFGLVQVEAMACGLPAVGASWGGLKDTIVDGVTGRQVPTVVTAAGVKVDWWSAANSIVELLARTEENRALRQRCARSVRERYSMPRYGALLSRVLEDSVAAAARPPERVLCSAFAERFWSTCMGEHAGARLDGSRPPYRRGAESWELYRELITPFAAAPSNGASAASASGWCLAAPLRMQPDGSIAVNDPIYPFEIPVPLDLAGPVRRLMSRFEDQPVLDDLTLGPDGEAAGAALAWMRQAGFLLRTVMGTLPARCARGALGQPVLMIREVDYRTDVVCIA